MGMFDGWLKKNKGQHASDPQKSKVKCPVHSGKDAIGKCRYCGRELCEECLTYRKPGYHSCKDSDGCLRYQEGEIPGYRKVNEETNTESKQSMMMNWIRNERGIIWAWAIGALINFLITPSTMPPEIRYRYKGVVATVLEALIIAAFYSFCLRFFAGRTLQPTKRRSQSIAIGVWGFVWRYWVLYFVSIVLMLILIFVAFWAAWTPPSILSILLILPFLVPLTAWLLFCPDRKNFAMAALRIVRGR